MKLRIAIFLVGGLFLPIGAIAQQPIPDDLAIIMERSNCEDGCPVYRIIIFGDGDVIWIGRNGVVRPGVVKSAIEPDGLRMLIQDFASLDFFGLDDIYGYHGRGCQKSQLGKAVVRLLFVMDGRSRSLWHHNGCAGEVSEKLTALQNKIDLAVGAEKWIADKRFRKAN
jgi:Domain of unknown function (DUF6438)